MLHVYPEPSMKPLKGSDRKYLRALAHSLDPVVYVGKQGLTDSLVSAVDEALNSRELIKLKFNDQKDRKKEILAEIESRTESHVVGLIGNIATLYREHPEEENRRIHLPED
jgi:RNA-binding protein